MIAAGAVATSRAPARLVAACLRHDGGVSRPRRHRAGVALLAVVALTAGCGLQVASPDLFKLTRSGPGETLTAVVNDGGTVRCNGHAAVNLPDPLLLSARDLATSLDDDAKKGLKFPSTGAGVYTYSFTLQDGTVSFADTAAGRRAALGRAALLATQIADGPCRGK